MRKEIPCCSMQETITESRRGAEDHRNEGACIKECNIDGCEFSAMSWIACHREIKTNLLNINSCVMASELEVA